MLVIAGWAMLLADLREFAVRHDDPTIALDVCGLFVEGADHVPLAVMRLADIARALNGYATHALDDLADIARSEEQVCEACREAAGDAAEAADLMLRTIATVRAITANTEARHGTRKATGA